MSTSDPERAELLRERARRLLPGILADAARAELRLRTAERQLRKVLADAATAGFRPQVDLDLSDGNGIRVVISGGWVGGWPWESSDCEAELLAGIADRVQEETMEGDQVHCLVWPVCTDHGLGGHAVVAEERAVWWCNGGTGHVIASIGQLAARPA